MARKKAGKNTDRFRGRVVPSIYDFQTSVSDVVGPHHVVYPSSQADVARAVRLSKNLTTFVRSGGAVAKQDTVDGSGGIVINMSELANVTVDKKRVKAQAGATMEGLVEQLAKHKLALPLGDDPIKSVASEVLFERPSYLMRSLGPLSDYVSRIQTVKPNGDVATVRARTSASCAAQCHDSNAVITSIEFEPAPAKDLWMFRVSFLYPGRDEFANIARTLFVKTKFTKTLERTDLVLDAYSGPYDIPLVRISALGSSTRGTIKLKRLVRESLAAIPKRHKPEIRMDEFYGTDVLEEIVDSGMGASLDETIESTRLQKLIGPDGDLENFIVRHAKDVHQGIAFGDEGDGKLNADSQLFASLRVNREDGLQVSGYSYAPKTLDVSTRGTPLHSGVPARIPRAFVSSGTKSQIPNFKGEIYKKKDPGYKKRAKQYATSSYSTGMTPFMVAYPRDEKDIRTAIKFTTDENKRLVARSGGHQYSGKSSGGQDTIVLSMDNFYVLGRVNADTVKVHPTVRLTRLAKEFESQGVTIPHGECPLVALGGHAQTGGYGHLVRSFGLTLDYVRSFEIILADCRQLTVTRPGPVTSPDNDKLFWGVLGGNAGSFGIITEYEFDCILDKNHPNSYGFDATRIFAKSAFTRLMKETQKWTRQIEKGTLADGIDFVMTVVSRDTSPVSLILVVLRHANLGGPKQRVDGDAVFKPIIKAGRYSLVNSWIKKGQQDLSSLSESFVKNGMKPDGREFKYPYKKRINGTMTHLSDQFIKELVDMVSDVLEEERVKLIFEMGFGGGAYKNSSRRSDTSIPHRDQVYFFVFDLFYKRRGKGIAEAYQRKMQDLIDRQFNNGQERRAFWGSFGDTDISKPKTQKMYYDDAAKYADLQKLKKKVDPGDLFHTSLTVKLP